jgi:pyridoxal phosphate enzyme (YggS family)
MSIAENIALVKEQIAAAARRAQRSPEPITLMAVSKTFPPDIIQQAYEAGLRIFGENRVQEFAAKADALQSLTEAEWHLIGHLQSNKAGKAVELFSAIDSVDSLRLAEKLNVSAEKIAKKIPVLIEINIGGEDVKSGVAPDSAELELLLSSASRLSCVQFRGLMTIPPFTEDPQGARPYFRKLRSVRDQIASRKLPGVSLDVLSMGMSHDFEVAIEEGSTCVRLGTAIFGARTKSAA